MSTFLETVITDFNRMRARRFTADGYEGVTNAGIALVNGDEVFLAQRTMDETDDPAVQQSWEFPGGSLDPGEQPYEAALREFLEETGLSMPSTATVTNGWRSSDGVYQGFVVDCANADMTEWHLADWQPTSECQAVGWFTQDALPENLRPEVRDDTPWDLIFGVSGNEETDMTQTAPDPDEITEDPAEEATETPEEEAAEEATEPDYADPTCFVPEHLMVHGVLAPEAAPSGDGRGFTDGAITSRPLRLPIGWQEWTRPGHDGAITTASIDRMMRKDGLIHFEGTMMTSEKADEFTDLLCFFGQYGISIDGVNGSIDMAKSNDTGMVWFDAAQVAGAVACSVPAFAEAYIALGPHPDMPETNDPEAMTASGLANTDIIGMRADQFARGPGWATDPKATSRIHDYWMPGHPGGDKIQWGKPGDFARAKALIGEKIAKHSPDKMRFLNQIIAQWHHDALGYWPSTHAKMDRAGVKAALSETADETVAESADIKADAEGTGWEAVLVSSAGARALPPSSYFEPGDEMSALVIEEPDEFGLRHTYGYAGEWGVCHIGHDGRCVEVPEDPTGEFASFHLGRTKTSDEGYINTGVITYKVDHRDARRILSESAEQQHFDNIAHAWAAVRLGMDDRGIWFSGVVLPSIPEDDLVLIEAAGQVSGEWLRGDLRALQAVNVPGFPVMRSSAAYDDEGNVVALVASAFGTSECEPSAFDRMQALARADAEARFETLRKGWTS